ncbi:cupin domain-containing protein [Vallitalea sediminicola]
MFNAEYFIEKLELSPHIEGGYYREIYNDTSNNIAIENYEGKRSLSTTIYYLLKSGQVSKFHKLISDEIWFYHYGTSLAIHMIDEQGKYSKAILGLNIEEGELPQLIVPANTIFGAEVVEDGDFTLVSCMVSPGFDFKDFKMYSRCELINEYPEYNEIIDRLNG